MMAMRTLVPAAGREGKTMTSPFHVRAWLFPLVALLTFGTSTARAADKLCDPGDEDCRAILINYIRNERVAIDVAFWFMEDARYTTELINKWNAGVPVRVLIDTRANPTYPLNADRILELQNAGIPIRRIISNKWLHWKMMLFSGQNVVQFSGANYSSHAWRPGSSTPYENYTDEAIYFTDNSSIVNTFRTKYDDIWVSTSGWTNYANITAPLVRFHDIFPKDPQLNMPPHESYRSRAVSRYNAEGRSIDVIMYRMTDRYHADAMIAAVQRGVPVRIISEPKAYRDPKHLWHSWNTDRMYMAGVEIKHRAHLGINHQKSVLLHKQQMVIFGSSNWTDSSNTGQYEHNMFTTQPHIYNWFVDQFERKWNNTGGVIENEDFVPLPPDAAKTPSPATGVTGVGTTVALKWYGGPWAHVYDVYFGTSSNPPLLAANLTLGPSDTTKKMQSYALPMTLAPGTTYYWKIVSRTVANMTKTSLVWTFTTAGSAPPPPPGGEGEVVLYASKAPVKAGAWQIVSDATAAGGARLHNPNAGAAKLAAALADPANYFEMTFTAEAGRPYRLWIRGKAQSNAWANDSVFIQFSNSVTSSGSATWRIGTTSATEVNLEDCSGCGLSGWGWQDNGWGVGVLGPVVYFGTSGTQRLRIQVREDGLSIDQIVLSPATYLSGSPGGVKDDNTILAQSSGG
jgi:HKD family nuclease